jgi:CRP-like cAMP-binding protein
MAAASSTFRVGESLFLEGSDAKSLYLVKAGRVSIRKAVNGGYIEIAQIGPNQIIGEVGFFDQRPRSANAVALSYCEVVEIPYEALKPIFDPAPDYLKKIMIGLASRLREADETIRELKERLGENEIPSASTPAVEDESANDSETQKILKMTE